MKFQNNYFFILTTSLFILLGVVTAYDMAEFCCDVYQYIDLAKSMDTNGFLYPHLSSNIRNYLYPYFLSMIAEDYIYNLTDFLYFTKLILLFLVLFSSAIFNYVMLLNFNNIYYSCGITLLLFLNPLLLTIYTLPLTELYVFPLFIILLSSLSYLTSISFNYRQGGLIYLFIGFILSMLILLRPANIALLLPVSYAAFVLLKNNKLTTFHTLLFFISFSILFIPQLIFNYTIFNKITAFPAGGLGDLQFDWGLMLAKYGTLFIDGKAEGLNYYSQVPTETLLEYKGRSLDYYLIKFPTSFALLFSHIFNSLNYDFLYTYINNKEYSIISWHQILSSFFTVFGFSYAVQLLSRIKTHYKDTDFIFLVVLFAFLGMNSLVAVETRFGMIPHIILCIFTFKLIFNPEENVSQHTLKIALAAFMLYLPVSIYASYYFVASTNVFNINWF